MHIGINTLSLHRAPGGREVFFSRVAESIARLQPEARMTCFVTDETADLYAKHARLRIHDAGSLNSQIAKAGVTALLSPLEGAVRDCSVPQTLLVSDLSAAEATQKRRFPWRGPKGPNIQPALEAAKRLIVPSQYVQRLLLEKFEIGMERIAIAPFGVDPVFEEDQVPFIEPPYIIAVGATAARRPIKSMLNVFNVVCAKTNHTLVVVGRPGENEPADWGKRVIRIEYVPQSQLAALYQHADVALMVSTWEGSGVSVLESLRSGTTPVCPRIGGIPEVAHNAPVYYNPESESDLLSAFRRALEERPSARRDRLDAGRKLTRSYTWDDCAWKTFNAVTRK